MHNSILWKRADCRDKQEVDWTSAQKEITGQEWMPLLTFWLTTGYCFKRYQIWRQCSFQFIRQQWSSSKLANKKRTSGSTNAPLQTAINELFFLENWQSFLTAGLWSGWRKADHFLSKIKNDNNTIIVWRARAK